MWQGRIAFPPPIPATQNFDRARFVIDRIENLIREGSPRPPKSISKGYFEIHWPFGIVLLLPEDPYLALPSSALSPRPKPREAPDIFIALVSPACLLFFGCECRPRLQSELAQLIRRQMLRFRFDFKETHNDQC